LLCSFIFLTPVPAPPFLSPTPAICGLLACIIFGAVINDIKEKRDFEVGFSLGLSITAFIFNLLGAGLLTIDSRNLSYHNVSDAVRRGGAGMMYVFWSWPLPFCALEIVVAL
jgi:hypothetical protein